MTEALKSVCFCWIVSLPTTGRAEVLADDVGQALAVLGRVVDDERPSSALSVSLMYLAAAGPWVASLPRARKKVFQPLSASFGLVADGVMVDEAGLVERRVGGLGLTGEGGADDADDLLVVDGLLGQRRRLRRVTLRVVVLEGDLAVGVLLVVVVEGEVDAVLDVDAEVGVRAGEGTEHADLVVAAGRGPAAGAAGDGVSPPLVPQAPRASAATASGTANLRVERTGVLLMSLIPLVEG